MSKKRKQKGGNGDDFCLFVVGDGEGRRLETTTNIRAGFLDHFFCRSASFLATLHVKLLFRKCRGPNVFYRIYWRRAVVFAAKESGESRYRYLIALEPVE
jgi:hypothetical protein